MNVIVTGGNGYIGSHMCRLLHKRGYHVYIFDNHSSSPSNKTHEYGTFFNVDLEDTESLTQHFKNIRPVVVFHFASKINVGESQENPLFYYQQNVSNTISLLKAMQNANIFNLVFSSTCAIFGEIEEPLHEGLDKNPISTYGKTKLLVENIIQDLCDKNLLKAICFRYFNAAGCSPYGGIGENHEPETHLIPKLCQLYLEKKLKDFKIFGNDYNTKDGTCVRDYIHVDDLAEYHLRGLNFLLRNDKNFHNYNLGSGSGYSVLDIVNSFAEITKEKIDIQFNPKRWGDAPKLIANNSKAIKDLKYTPIYGIKDCIQHTLNFQETKYV